MTGSFYLSKRFEEVLNVHQHSMGILFCMQSPAHPAAKGVQCAENSYYMSNLYSPTLACHLSGKLEKKKSDKGQDPFCLRLNKSHWTVNTRPVRLNTIELYGLECLL